MLLYKRDFRLSHLLKIVSILGSAASPLLLRALRKGPLTAFEFSWRTLEVYQELIQNQPIPGATLLQLGAAQMGDQRIWMDLSQPSSEMPPGELAVLCSLVKWKNPQVVVEIGTFKGLTTLHLSKNTSDTCHIYTVDLPPEAAKDPSIFSDPQLVQKATKTERAYGNDPKITQILQDSTTIEWGKILDRPVDFAFVDASHLYHHVRGDTEGILKVLAPEGVVVWHDYRPVEIRRGVKKYLVELHNQGMPLKHLVNTSFCVYQRAESGRYSPNLEASISVSAA